jgi:hypothetical protein
VPAGQPIGGNQGVHADTDFAAGLLNQGAPAEEIRDELRKRGVDPTTAATIIRAVFAQGYRRYAAAVLNRGVHPKQVGQQLADNGIEPQVATAVINDILAREKAQARRERRVGCVLQYLGCLIFFVGLGLWLGNRTGLFPTFPYAGSIVMVIGLAVAGAEMRVRQPVEPPHPAGNATDGGSRAGRRRRRSSS